MLVPVIGILQVGAQAYADRYTYLPQIGIIVAATWAAAHWAAPSRNRLIALRAIAVLTLGALSVAASRQAGYWRNSETLWDHTLECTTNNPTAHNDLGIVLSLQGRFDEAMAQFNEALRIFPLYANAHCNLGYTLFLRGRTQEAIAQCNDALQINPSFAQAHYVLGNALLKAGRTEEAIAHFREASRINPTDADAFNSLGNALLHLGRAEEAIAQYRAALQINPTVAATHMNLGFAFYLHGEPQQAVVQCEEALRINPALGNAHYIIANALLQQGQPGEAIAHLKQAHENDPADLAAQNQLAWLLATTPQLTLRDGPTALQLAAQARQSSGGRDPMILRTLAAAYAQTGQFPNALQAAQLARQQAQAQNKPSLTAALTREIQLYQSGHPYEDAH